MIVQATTANQNAPGSLEAGAAIPNRATRRKANAGGRRFALAMRATAWILNFAMLHAIFAPHLPTATRLFAQPVFENFEERSRQDAKHYVDRARRLDDADAWTNYVELGIASEYIEWEAEALEQVRNSYQDIDENEALDDDQKTFEKDLVRAEFDAAAAGWQLDADEYLIGERALYRVESAELTVEQISESEYSELIAGADAAVTPQFELNLNDWDAAIALGRGALAARFNDSLSAALDGVRAANAGLTGAELNEFEDALAARETELRAEFTLRDHFYVQRARNSYIAEKRADDVSLRLAADKNSAEAVGDQVIDATLNEVSAETTAALEAAEAGLENLLAGADFDEAQFDGFTTDWERQMEAVVSAGLQKWDRAEEDLYRRRLAWLDESKRSRAEGEEIWQRNHSRIKAARETWLSELQDRIQEGYELWDEKFAEFAESRVAAEAELNQFISEERARRSATLAQVGDMVRGGGAALGEAKDAYYYYNALLDELPAPPGGCAAPANRDEQLYCFYQTQRDNMQASIGRFQTILADVDATLDANMHSAENHTGFLRDVRHFARELPAEIAALDTANFKNELRADMQTRGEEYMLYRADLYELSDANALFVRDTSAMLAEQPFDYDGAADLAALRELVTNLDPGYGDQRQELLRIVDRDRDGLPDDAAKLAAIKSDIAAWSTRSVDENARLRTVTLEYFEGGAAGYYLSGNENDPYLMTRSEFEWELLRRERNYLAKRMRRAAEVNRYAELASKHDSGLEMAQVTVERADITKIRSDIRELHYLLIKGDLNVDPLAVTDNTIRDAEYELALSERGIAPAFLNDRETDLNMELAVLDAAAGNAAPDVADLDSLIAASDAILIEVTADLAADATEAERQTARDEHRMGVVRAKLLQYRAELQSGSATTATLADRWTTLRGGFAALGAEINALKAEYDFDALRDELASLRDAFGDRSLQSLQGDLRLVRDDLEANAAALAVARQRLEDAKTAYRDARIDFDIINASNSEELIRIDIANTSGELAGVLNRMAEIEDIDGMAGKLFDPVTVRRAEYLFEVSENARAKNDIAYADQIFLDVQGLEKAKERVAALESALSATAGENDPLALVDVFLDRKGQLLETAALEPELASLGPAQRAFENLQLARDQYATAQTALDAAVAAADPDAAEIAIKTAELEQARFAILRSIEMMIPAIRGEERARREVVLHLLGTGGTAADLLSAEAADDERIFADRSFALSERAGTALRDFLETHRGDSFTELLETMNAEIAAANRGLRSDAQGYGVDSAGSSHDAYERLTVVRDWIIRFRADIDYVNSAPEDVSIYDRRSPDEKWESLLQNARDTEEDGAFYRDFANAIPTAASDAWVTNYRDERSALRDRLDAALTVSDAGLAVAYANLSPDDRNLFVSYGAVIEQAGAAELRASLIRVRRAIELDLLQLNTGFREVYLREQGFANQRILDGEGRRYSEIQGRLALVRSERSELQRDLDSLDAEILAESEPAARLVLENRRDDVTARVAELNVRTSELEAQAEPLRDRLRQATNALREMERPGSSALLVAAVRSAIESEGLGIDLQLWAADTILRKRDVREGDVESLQEKLAARDYGATTEERLKAIIGFYQTDSASTILRDDDGLPLVAQEFIDLGITDANADLLETLSGSQTGPNLERWSERLLRALEDPQRSARLAPEVGAAARQLEGALADLAAARSFIEARDTPAAALMAEATAERTRLNELSRKITLFRQFEDTLRQTADDARANQLNPGDALLGELEKSENAFIFRLFQGFDENGTADGVADADLDARVQQLRTLFERMRGQRRDQAIAEIADAYGAALEAHLVDYAVDPIAAGTGPEAAVFFENYDFLKAAPIESAVGALAGDDDFRANLWAYVDGLSPAARLYKSAIVSVLHASNAEGATLKTAVSDAIDALELELEDGLVALTGEAGRRMLRDRDLEVESSVAALIADHAAANPTLDAPELDALADELYVRELNRALAISDSSHAYDPDDYPAELRDFVLLRAYHRGTDRMAAYRDAMASDVPAVRDAAVLDLRGMMGEVANSLLVQDFDLYLSAHSTAAFLADGEGGPRGVGEYIAAYYLDRQTGGELLPAGGAVLFERATHAEYLRLNADAVLAGGLAQLDESEYFADFRAYIILAQLDDYMSANGLSLVGATREERKTNFENDFEALLDDPAYANGDGETLRQRLLASSAIDAIFQLAFAYLEETPGHDAYLPPALAERRLAGTLDDPLANADSFLPPELTAIAGYASADYRAVLAAIPGGYAAELARLETAAEFQSQLGEARLLADYEHALHADDAGLDAIIAAAGHDGVDSATRAILRSQLKAQYRAAYLRTNGVEPEQSALGVDYTQSVAAILRQDAALRELAPATAEREGLESFFRAEGARFDSIENIFFAELENSDGRLREAAKANRGDFLRAIVERSRGANTAYYNGLDPEIRVALDALQNRLFAGLSPALSGEQQSALRDAAADYERAFALRSAQELVTSGIFERLDNILMSGVLRGNPDGNALESAVRERRSDFLKALVQTIQVQNGTRAGPDVDVAALLAATPGAGDEISRIAEEMDPEFAKLIEREDLLINRFLDRFREADADRRELLRVIEAPALLNSASKLAIREQSAHAVRNSAIGVAEAEAALLLTIQDHDRLFADTQRGYQREIEASGRLEDFARRRGDNPLASRFSNYRTYIGSERAAQQNAYDKYEANLLAIKAADPGNTDPILGFDEYHGGQVLEADDLGLDANTLFDQANWEELLISDDVDAGRDIVLRAGQTDEQRLETRRVRRISAASERERFGNDYNAEIAYTYRENLANNYLEAVSQLNAALNSVFLSAKLADKRLESDPQKNLREELAGKYDAHAAAGVNELDDILTAKQNAQSRLADHDDGKLQSKRQAVDSTRGGFSEAAQSFADAARRGQVRTMNLVSYLESVYTDVADEMDAAQTEVTDLADASDALQTNYAAANQSYVNRLNDMASAYRGFQQANDEYETALAVKEYAETPYLFAATTEVDVDLDEYSADARGEYEIAVAALENANERLREAAFNVETQDRLADFSRIVAGLEGGTSYPPLSDAERERYLELQNSKHGERESLAAAEETELDALVLREMHERYGDLIAARADHIKHSMRMVRIHKANEIVNAEVERLRGVVQEKKKKFDRELDQRFGSYSDEADLKARNTVYMRLAGKVQAGEQNFYQEFRGWYWGMGQWSGPYADAATQAAMNGGSIQITPTQITEAQQGLLIGNTIPADEREAIGRWLATDPPFAEFNGFRGSYFNQLTISGQADMALVERIVTQAMAVIQAQLGAILIAAGTLSVSAGATMLALGTTSLSVGFGLAAGIITAPAAPPPIALGTAALAAGSAVIAAGLGLIAGGVGMISAAIAQVAAATAKLALLKQLQLLQLGNSVMLSGTDSVRKVLDKQNEFEAAQAQLDYFTRVPDMQTLKDRMIQFGASRTDNDSPENLYKLTDEDLKYMFDRASGSPEYKDSRGAALVLSAQEESHAYDASGTSVDLKFRDSFNRLYNPQTLTDTQPGPLDGGTYGDGWTRIQSVDHAGNPRFQYAKLLPTDPPPANDEFAVYNMGEVFNSLVAHGQELRDQRRDAYLATGDGLSGERRFVLEERDRTFDRLFADAGSHVEGGNEYTGYRMVYEEYEANQNAIFEAELNQRVQLQLKEWQLREQELNDRFESWKTRMNAVVAKGREQWGDSENRFLQQWRDWERERDAEERKARADWEAATKTHLEKRQNWEEQIRTKIGQETARETLSAAIDALNNQIRASSNSLGLNLETINRNAKINEAIDEINKSLPSSTEKLAELNAGIQSFNTNLALSELAGTNTGTGTLGADYRDAMNKHVKRMKTQAKVKMYEQYRRLVDGFKLQIQDQNEAVENQTRTAALSQGYVQAGSRYIKASTHVRTFGAVDAYVYFDTEAGLAQAMSDVGFNTLEGDALFTFLETKSDVEVESFFYTQKLAAQSVFEKLLGKAKTEEERKAGMATRNQDVIGQFAYWVGQGPDEAAQQQTQRATQAAGNSFASNIGARNIFLQTQFGAGFGELGTGSQRLSGPALGFYLQLGIFDDLIMQERARNGLIQSMQKNRNDMIREQGANMTKTFVKTIAQSVITGAAAVSGPAGWAVAAGAAAAIYAADSTQVDPNTGRVIMKGTEQAALGFATSLVSAASGSTLLNTAINATAGAAQYNEKGQITGFNYETGASGAAVGRSILSSAAGSAGNNIGGFVGVAVKTAMNLATERAIEINIGAQYANYQGVATSAITDGIAEGYGATAARERARAVAEKARKTANKHQSADIIRGIGNFFRREWEQIQGVGSNIAKGVGAIARGFGWQSADNYIRSGAYVDDKTLRDAHKKLLKGTVGSEATANVLRQMRESGLYSEKELAGVEALARNRNTMEALGTKTRYTWRDNNGRTTSRYDNIAATIARENGHSLEQQMQLDVFANYPDEMANAGITDPSKIPPEMVARFAQKIQQKIYDGQPVAHFEGASYTSKTHQAFALNRAANAVGMSRWQVERDAKIAGVSVHDIIQYERNRQTKEVVVQQSKIVPQPTTYAVTYAGINIDFKRAFNSFRRSWNASSDGLESAKRWVSSTTAPVTDYLGLSDNFMITGGAGAQAGAGTFDPKTGKWVSTGVTYDSGAFLNIDISNALTIPLIPGEPGRRYGNGQNLSKDYRITGFAGIEGGGLMTTQGPVDGGIPTNAISLAAYFLGRPHNNIPNQKPSPAIAPWADVHVGFDIYTGNWAGRKRLNQIQKANGQMLGLDVGPLVAEAGVNVGEFRVPGAPSLRKETTGGRNRFFQRIRDTHFQLGFQAGLPMSATTWQRYEKQNTKFVTIQEVRRDIRNWWKSR